MSEKLYYRDSYLSEFSASVVRCDAAGDLFRVILSETAFYPEGGGQPADRGEIDGIPVLDVQEEDGEVVHFLPSLLPVGEKVYGRVDFSFRFSLMQQHSGEHILSGLAHTFYGCNNVGFHMGKDCVTVDFDRPLSAGDLVRLEQESNERIYENSEIRSYVLSSGEAGTISYRFKKALSGEIRIVEIPGTDICACCGLHTRRTGEIGMVKIESFQNYKGGVRLFLKIGKTALEDYRQKNDELHTVAASLSVKPQMLAESVAKLAERADRLRQEKREAEDRYFRLLAGSVKEVPLPCIWEDGLEPDSLRRLACLLCETTGKDLCSAFSGSPGAIRYAIASRTDARPLCQALNRQFSGRGGGKKDLCCGSLSSGSCEEIKKEIDAFET